MDKKKTTIAVIFLLAAVVVGMMGWLTMTGYSKVLKINWGIDIPVSAHCSEIYEKDSGDSFHGDGIRYHVLSYKDEAPIETMTIWNDKDQTTIFHSSIYETAEQWLNEIAVPEEWRPDYANVLFCYSFQADNSELILFWNKEADLLYIAESFL